MSLQLHSPSPQGQYPKEEPDHAELPHHHPKTPPCPDLGITAPNHARISVNHLIKENYLKRNSDYTIITNREHMKERHAALSK